MENISDVIQQKIINFLGKYGLAEKKNKLLTAFSGGPDSLCLLNALYNINKNYNFKLAAAHLNHNWRGEESKLEAERAENYCKERGIEFYTETLPVELPRTEEEARNRRYEFLNKTAKTNGSTAILTGHTRTDQVETVLYRIIKGTGTAGLTGIPEMRAQKGLPAIYRPLLTGVCREDCIKYCEENALSPSFDPGNYDEKYLRNKVRHSLLPELKTYNNAVEDALVRLSVISRESEEITGEYIKEIKEKVIENHNSINTKEFLKLSDPLKKRILVDFLGQNHIKSTFERIEDLFDFIEKNTGSKSGKTFSIARDLWFFMSGKEMKIITRTKAKSSDMAVPVSFEKETFHPGLNISIKIEEWIEAEPKRFPEESADIVFADLNGIDPDLYLRNRRPGDIIQPFGMKQKTKLKKYLINRGIPKHIRDEIPLLVNKDEVLWVVGIGISELLRTKTIPTHRIRIKRRGRFA